MGSNEFPPPPPPGQPPQPNWPPQQPGFPTQQVPTTQAYPQQGLATEALAPEKGNGLLIGAGLLVVAALIGGIVLLMGGDDDKKSTITLAPITSSTLATDTTAAAGITLPPTVPVTDAHTVPTTVADDSFTRVTDETGTFSMDVLDSLELDITTITTTDVPPLTVPSISAAYVIDSYNTDDVTFGFTAVSVGPLIGSDAAQVMAFLEPPDGTCTGRVEDVVETFLGTANRVSLTGCGVGAGNKVLMVLQLADRPVVIGIYMQALDPVEDVQGAARFAFESILVA